MRGRKRKIPSDFVPRGWISSSSEEDVPRIPLPNLQEVQQDHQQELQRDHQRQHIEEPNRDARDDLQPQEVHQQPDLDRDDWQPQVQEVHHQHDLDRDDWQPQVQEVPPEAPEQHEQLDRDDWQENPHHAFLEAPQHDWQELIQHIGAATNQYQRQHLLEEEEEEEEYDFHEPEFLDSGTEGKKINLTHLISYKLIAKFVKKIGREIGGIHTHF